MLLGRITGDWSFNIYVCNKKPPKTAKTNNPNSGIVRNQFPSWVFLNTLLDSWGSEIKQK